MVCRFRGTVLSMHGTPGGSGARGMSAQTFVLFYTPQIKNPEKWPFQANLPNVLTDSPSCTAPELTSQGKWKTAAVGSILVTKKERNWVTKTKTVCNSVQEANLPNQLWRRHDPGLPLRWRFSEWPHEANQRQSRTDFGLRHSMALEFTTRNTVMYFREQVTWL